MGKKHTGPVRKRRLVGASRVDSPPAGSPSHISISKGDRSPLVPLGVVTLVLSSLPLRVLLVSAYAFPVNGQPPILERRVGHPSLRFQLVPQTGLPNLPLPHLQNLATFIP